MMPTRLLLLCFCVPGLATVAAPPKMTLVWAEEFETPGAPDPARWVYEEGFVRNQEEQFYTRDRRENARVENGVLILEARKEAWPNPAHRPGSRGWQHARPAAAVTSASITTEGKAAWRYGRIEVRAKVPAGQGSWPAIWMLGENHSTDGWPRCGEIDIMEFVGLSPRHVHSTVHFAGDGAHRSSGNRLEVAEPWKDFHVYAVDWTAERMDFSYDGRKVHTFPLDEAGTGPDNPFRKPQYLLLNLAIGGGGWAGNSDPAIFPCRFDVDYVRVYQQN